MVANPCSTDALTALNHTELAAQMAVVDAQFASVVDDRCATNCITETVPGLHETWPDCAAAIQFGELESTACAAVLAIVADSDCPALAPLYECAIFIPQLSADHAACMAQLATGNPTICPSPCQTFALTVLNNPCTSPAVASLFPSNVSIALADLEAGMVSASQGACETLSAVQDTAASVQESVEAFVASSPCVEATLPAVAEYGPTCVSAAEAGDHLTSDSACAALWPYLTNSSCPPLVRLQQCLVALPTLLVDADACEEQLLAGDFLTADICPTPCQTFVLTAIGHPCSAPLSSLLLSDNTTTRIAQVEATIEDKSNGLCESDCKQLQIDLAASAPACAASLTDGVMGRQGCNAFLEEIATTTCALAAPMQPCAAALPELEAQRSQCADQLERSDVLITDQCPSACAVFMLNFLGNECSELVIANSEAAQSHEEVDMVAMQPAAEILSAKGAALETYITEYVAYMCNSTCIQGTLQALEDEVPLCTAEFVDATPPAIGMTNPGPCGDVYTTVQESECIVLQQLTYIIPSWIAREVYNSSAVSSDCLEWTRFVPRAAWTCAIAVSQATALGKICPEECNFALNYLEAGRNVCTQEEFALLPQELRDTATKLVSIADPLCTTDCLTSLTSFMSITTDCITSLSIGGVASSVFGGTCEEAIEIHEELLNCSGTEPALVLKGVSPSCYEWAKSMADAAHSCTTALSDPSFNWKLADACPVECTDALTLAASKPCTDEDLDALPRINGSDGSFWSELHELADHFYAKTSALCFSDCLSTSLPAIRELYRLCTISAQSFDSEEAAALVDQRFGSAEEEPGTCMQFLAAVDSSSCFTRDELGGMLPPEMAERLLVSLGVSPTCLDWAASAEASFDACKAAYEYTEGCPTECAEALTYASTGKDACSDNEMWRLPPAAADLKWDILAFAGANCAGECRNSHVEELNVMVQSCAAQLDERFTTDFCPIACLEMFELFESSPCVPPALEVAFLPSWFGTLKTACALQSECLAEMEEIKPAIGSCFSELLLLPPGTAHCHNDCIAAAQMATNSDCLEGLEVFTSDLRDRADQIANSDYANSRSITNFEKLMRALAYGAAARAFGKVYAVAQSMCEGECTELTSSVATTCEADLVAGSCSSDCYVAQYEAAQGCLKEAGVAESVADTWSIHGVTRSCELLCLGVVPSEVEALCTAPDACLWECRAFVGSIAADEQLAECLTAFGRLGLVTEPPSAEETSLSAQRIVESCGDVDATGSCPVPCQLALKDLEGDGCTGKLDLILDEASVAAISSECSEYVGWLNNPPPSPAPHPATPPFAPPFTPPSAPPGAPAVLPPKGR